MKTQKPHGRGTVFHSDCIAMLSIADVTFVEVTTL
jgi:hypothetical protein